MQSGAAAAVVAAAIRGSLGQLQRQRQHQKQADRHRLQLGAAYRLLQLHQAACLCGFAPPVARQDWGRERSASNDACLAIVLGGRRV